MCLHHRDNEDDEVCLPERRKSSGQRFRPLMTLKQRRRSLLSASSLPIQIPNRPNGAGSDGQLQQQDSGISPSPVGRWKRALRQVRTLSDPWAKFELESLPTEKAKRYRYSALKKKWVTDDVSVKMESEVCCFHSQLCSCINVFDCFLNFDVGRCLLIKTLADSKLRKNWSTELQQIFSATRCMLLQICVH